MYAGLVFVSLSQPYMQHQYGKDWARKAPIRLCDRVLYGILNKTGQEVILLSQVSILYENNDINNTTFFLFDLLVFVLF